MSTKRKRGSSTPSVLQSLGIAVKLNNNRQASVVPADARVRRINDSIQEKKDAPVASKLPKIGNSDLTDLHRACRQGILHDVQFLIESDATLAAARSTNSEDSLGSGGTAVHFCVLGNRPDILEYLLQQGAQVNSISDRGMTPLHVACTRGLSECANVLLKGGACPVQKDRYGVSSESILNQPCGDVDLRKNRALILRQLKSRQGRSIESIQNHSALMLADKILYNVSFLHNVNFGGIVMRKLSHSVVSSRSQIGSIGEANYRLFFHGKDGRPMSPWHDILLPPLNNKNLVLPFVCEIPRGKPEKMEVRLSEPFNPIAQDTKQGKPRKLSVEPKFSYGMLPQTYESKTKMCPISGLTGDGDPLDVVDIASTSLEVGAVVPAKLLGSFCFVDGGEADWKLIVSSDESASLNQAAIDLMFSFFESYKGPESGNYIYENGKVFGVSETIDVLTFAHINYQEVLNSYRIRGIGGESDGNVPRNLWVPNSTR